MHFILKLDFHAYFVYFSLKVMTLLLNKVVIIQRVFKY